MEEENCKEKTGGRRLKDKDWRKKAVRKQTEEKKT